MHMQHPDTIVMIHNALVQDEMGRQLPRRRSLVTERLHSRGPLDLIRTAARYLAAARHSATTHPRIPALAEESAR